LFGVAGYAIAVRERFDRCQDLYLCPRELQKRIPDASAELLPELPDLEDLKPYPTAESVRFVGHTGRVRSIDISPTGTLLASGGSDGELRIWEIQTGFCIEAINLRKWTSPTAVVTSVAFGRTSNRLYIAACCGRYCFLVRLHEDDFVFPEPCENFLMISPNIMAISHARVVDMRQCVFNRSGAFLAVLGQSRLVFIYNTTTWEYRAPITSAKSYIQCVQFHPIKPRFFVATQHHVLVFDLVEKMKLMQLRPQVQWISSIDIHPSGEHVLATSYDGRAFWFDMELQVEPFRVLRQHSGAVRDVRYHRRFPLFASCGDDAKVYVFHGAVFDDLVTNPRIVPVKELSGHEKNNVLGVLGLAWHPSQPWLVSAGADHSIRLWC
jgi:ribosome biogenesis protein ERB1